MSWGPCVSSQRGCRGDGAIRGWGGSGLAGALGWEEEEEISDAPFDLVGVQVGASVHRGCQVAESLGGENRWTE